MQTNPSPQLAFGFTTTPVCLPSAGSSVPDGTMMTAAGWGLTASTRGSPTTSLGSSNRFSSTAAVCSFRSTGPMQSNWCARAQTMPAATLVSPGAPHASHPRPSHPFQEAQQSRRVAGLCRKKGAWREDRIRPSLFPVKHGRDALPGERARGAKPLFLPTGFVRAVGDRNRPPRVRHPSIRQKETAHQ
ncbi:trypsin-like serine protease [Archangium violaceum]|uniref:trypsin-like serine protease n=1 Tax=Archangium violaceum TaxID=83451 RepID=UPI0036D7B353